MPDTPELPPTDLPPLPEPPVYRESWGGMVVAVGDCRKFAEEYARAAILASRATRLAAAPKGWTDERIREAAHRTCTQYAHVERVKYGFTDTDLIHFVRTLLDAAPAASSPSSVALIDANGVTMFTTTWERIKDGIPPDYTEEEFRAYSSIQLAREMAHKAQLDAERYRWLRRDNRPCDKVEFVDINNGCGAFGAATEDELDAAIDAARAASSPEAADERANECNVTREDANNYCAILSALGMEEEGDPVAEVKRLIAFEDDANEAAALASAPAGAGEGALFGFDRKELTDAATALEKSFPVRPTAESVMGYAARFIRAALAGESAVAVVKQQP